MRICMEIVHVSNYHTYSCTRSPCLTDAIVQSLDLSNPSVLLVDDDPHILRSLSRFFQNSGWATHTAPSGEDAVRAYEAVAPDVVLLDLVLPGISGLEVLELIVPAGATVVLLTGEGQVSTAVEAMRKGAENFLTKPVEMDYLEAALLKALRTARLREVNRRLSAAVQDGTGDKDFFGGSARMQALAERAHLFARSDSTILLMGESGVGKGWLARRMHQISPRSAAPFVTVNCAGLSATFLDSELFGHEKGAFTDARQAKEGLFEVANGGTLFLDEIGDLAVELQPKLLKVLEETTFRRLGGTREITADVRLIAATNHDLEAAVDAGRFRADLYHRINVLALSIPPFRERDPEDVLEMIHRVFRELAREGDPALSRNALDLLLGYDWPGNVRELRNILERALVLARGQEQIRVEHLPPSLRGSAPLIESRDAGPVEPLEAVERRHIVRALEVLNGNRTRAAEALGISRATLYAKIDQFGLQEVGRA